MRLAQWDMSWNADEGFKEAKKKWPTNSDL